MLTKTIGSSPLPETDPIAQTPTSTIPYIYGDANWKDKLTSFNGNAITYDNVGNPLTYAGYNYTWEDGRQLAGISGNSKTISYSYNDQGIRQSKTVNGTTTTYRLVGDRVSWEGNGTDSIYYTYDGTGNLVSMNLNGTEYFYTRNLQGDITGLIDSTGTQVVSYSYDSWGKVLSTTGSLADTLGQKNPYRYRGYRLDSETGMYYLNSRYYVPEWGRMLNIDAVIGAVGELELNNLFVYAANNPTTLKDPSGYRPISSATVNSETEKDRETTFNYIKETNTEHKSTSVKGEPNSTVDLPKGLGQREYGPDGKVKRDTHNNDHGYPKYHPTGPHQHNWTWDGDEPNPGPPLPIDEIGIGVATVGAGYVIYRGVRLLPSFLPVLWWTIPANVVCP